MTLWQPKERKHLRIHKFVATLPICRGKFTRLPMAVGGSSKLSKSKEFREAGIEFAWKIGGENPEVKEVSIFLCELKIHWNASTNSLGFGLLKCSKDMGEESTTSTTSTSTLLGRKLSWVFWKAWETSSGISSLPTFHSISVLWRWPGCCWGKIPSKGHKGSPVASTHVWWESSPLRITGPCYRGVWMCIAGVWDLQTTSFEISWFLGPVIFEIFI